MDSPLDRELTSLAEKKVNQGLSTHEIGLQRLGNGRGVTAPKGIDPVVNHQDIHVQKQGFQRSINLPVPHQPVPGRAAILWGWAPADANHRGPSAL